MLKHYLLNVLYTVLATAGIVLPLSLSSALDGHQAKSAWIGIPCFVAVFSVYYFSCLRNFQRDAPIVFISRTIFGFVLKVILTVGVFAYLHRHYDFDLRFTAAVFVTMVLVNFFVSMLTVGMKMK